MNNGMENNENMGSEMGISPHPSPLSIRLVLGSKRLAWAWRTRAWPSIRLVGCEHFIGVRGQLMSHCCRMGKRVDQLTTRSSLCCYTSCDVSYVECKKCGNRKTQKELNKEKKGV
jgi:hypothetical protein